MEEVITSYKGMNKNMQCRGFQFEAGKEYECDGDVNVCENGFHACEKPLDVFNYYKPTESRYFSVEQKGPFSKCDEDSKIASKKIKIGVEIGIPGIVKAQVEYVKKSANGSAATSGYKSSAATSGNGSNAATSGDWSSAATSGYRSSAATSGYKSSAATSGNESSAATSGNGSSAATSGEESSAATSNKNAIAVACGKNSIAKGVVGSYIVLTEWNEDATELLTAKMARVDGKKIKANTWYKLVNGEFIEVMHD